MWCHYMPDMEFTPIEKYDQEMICYALEWGSFADLKPMLDVIYSDPYGEFVDNCLHVIPQVHEMGAEVYLYLHILNARGQLPDNHIVEVLHTTKEFIGF